MSDSQIGILGGGQLGRMLALAGYPLGARFRIYEPAPAAPAGQLAPQFTASYDDWDELARFADGPDAITYEFENVPVEVARWLAERTAVFPPPAALESAQDRLVEKQFFRDLGIATPPFAAIDSRDDLTQAVATIGLPAVLKTRRLGYDGKGQAVLRRPKDLAEAWEALGGVPLILEGFIPFQRELSILAARNRAGEIACYPLVENHHSAGILRLSLAPAPRLTAALQTQAEAIAQQVLTKLDYVGILAIELFDLDGTLIVNEMAPRVHNSGHWTIEGAETSQFENHMRAVMGLPLGSTALRGYAAMVNLIGALPDPAAVLRVPGVHLHLYGKSPRRARKVGHITLRADSQDALDATLTAIQGMVQDDG